MNPFDIVIVDSIKINTNIDNIIDIRLEILKRKKKYIYNRLEYK